MNKGSTRKEPARRAHALPQSVVDRLTRYLAHMQLLCDMGVKWVSSQEMAETFDLTSSTVRQDLSHIDFSGTSRRGYETALLEQSLARELGADISWNVVIVGAGNLGRAFALLEDFPRHGFTVCGIFDNVTGKTGTHIGNLKVQSMRMLSRVVRARNVAIGIITVPAPAAQSVADALVKAGVRGLLNLALTHVTAPKRVPIVDSRVVASMQKLSHALTRLGRR